MYRIQLIDLRLSDQMDYLIVKDLTTKKVVKNVQINKFFGIVFGGYTSTFMKFRQDILEKMEIRKRIMNTETNASKKKERLLEDISLPFYNWNCVSLTNEWYTLDLEIEESEYLWFFITAM